MLHLYSAWYNQFFNLNPVNIKSTDTGTTGTIVESRVFADILTTYGWVEAVQYCAVLGHNLFSNGIRFRLTCAYYGGTDAKPLNFYEGSAVNGEIDGQWVTPGADGYTIAELPTSDTGTGESNYDDSAQKARLSVRFNDASNSNTHSIPFKLGDVSVGCTYTMPTSADVSLTQRFVNESTKKVMTSGGNTITNSKWGRPPKWIMPAWELSDDGENVWKKGMFPNGRRQWDLSFSFFDRTKLLQEDLFSSRGIMLMSGELPIGIHDNFYSKVVVPTNNFQLPFIFQPDSTIQEYAIAEILQNSFEVNQVAPGLFSTNLTISECW